MQSVAGGFELRSPEVSSRVEHLALQVGQVDLVKIDETDLPDPRGGKVQRRRGAETSGTHEQHLGQSEGLLAGHADLGEQEVAAVSPQLLAGQRVRRRRGKHGERSAGRGTPRPGRRSARDGGNDRDDVAVLHRRRLAFEVPDVLVVEIDRYKVPQRPSRSSRGAFGGRDSSRRHFERPRRRWRLVEGISDLPSANGRSGTSGFGPSRAPSPYLPTEALRLSVSSTKARSRVSSATSRNVPVSGSSSNTPTAAVPVAVTETTR